VRVLPDVRLTCMAKLTIEVSEELAALVLAAEAKLEEQAKAAKEFAALDIDGTQAAIRESANSVGKDMQRRWLQSLTVKKPRSGQHDLRGCSVEFTDFDLMPKTRVGGFNFPPTPRIGTSRARRQRTHWGKLRRAEKRATGSRRYLSPEPLLQAPEVVSSKARIGSSVQTYAYSENNPIRNSDPSGLYTIDAANSAKCPNYATAVEQAKDMAGCGSGRTNACSECQNDIQACTKRCDICATIEGGLGPPLVVDWPDPLGAGTHTTRRFFGLGSLEVTRVSVSEDQCRNPAGATELAGTLLHEAIHVCEISSGVPGTHNAAGVHRGGKPAKEVAFGTTSSCGCDPTCIEAKCRAGR
jgi:hypothetical protein